MDREKKTNSEFIIDALLTGRDLRSPEITQLVTEQSGKSIKIQDIASILAKLSNSEKCDLGFFIYKKRSAKGYTYHLVPEALTLPAEALYGLTRKTGKNRYTLEQTLADYPDLKKYVSSARLKNREIKHNTKKRRKSMDKTISAIRLPNQTASTRQNEDSDQAIKMLVAQVLDEISEQGGLNININLNVRFTGIGEE
ncbi:MAG: hypothetical protein K9K81_11335 [Desulfobacteraceae bacterium]|nr:hypothetical protein [Desulfobacteraceae bacterium]